MCVGGGGDGGFYTITKRHLNDKNVKWAPDNTIVQDFRYFILDVCFNNFCKLESRVAPLWGDLHATGAGHQWKNSSLNGR